MRNIFEGHEFEAVCIGIAGAATTAIAALGSITHYREKKLETERLLGMPDSYWEAEKAKAEASVKKHELDIQHKERMTLDDRERAERERQAKREFEKTAPPEYWDAMARKAEAEERGKTERANAKAQADAIENAARQLRHAINNDKYAL